LNLKLKFPESVLDMSEPTSPITEDDIANFLVNTPDFFERHAELLATVQLSSGHGHRAVSLQERQAEMLREKIRALELQMAQMIRHGQDNEGIIDKMQSWTRDLLMCADASRIPQTIVDGVQEQFSVDEAALKVWGVASQFAGDSYAVGVSDEVRSFAGSMTAPYCGKNAEFEAANWLVQPSAAASIALVPLRVILKGGISITVGLLVLASKDPERFTSTMGTEILARLGELSAAALMRLRA
jgi:uncharacterized protein YigA (DUF484 family)